MAPVLSKFNSLSKRFEPVEALIGLFSGTLGEQYEKIHMSELFLDQKGVFWIFNEEGGVFAFESTEEEITSIDYFNGMDITSITYDDVNEVFYLFHQISDKRNIISIPSDYEIIKYFPGSNQTNIIKEHPFYWPNYTEIWIDNNGKLWFDSFGYLDTNQNWHLLMPNIGGFIYGTYFEGRPYILPRNIFLETPDGELWYKGSEGYRGIAWRSTDNLEGCWDSLYVNDVYEDRYQQLWMINKDGLYLRNTE